ncbi:CCA tRNA nucleotidyltransferase [Candidatus Woesearchaeota archaeon]|nr:CCA tRNA nucleotidyltransferase [Candidatus Woesearchaeota archaeon]
MFDKILKNIKPTKKEEEEVQKKVDLFLKKINSKLLNANAIVCGSFAKGTWLRNQHDIDIFVLFENNKNISTRLEVVIKAAFEKYEKIHGSRDYFIVDYENLSFELVPVLKIDQPEQAENITDVTPMHVEWVKKYIDNKLKDEIRLAKRLLKANNCYGAETYIGGFSGYLVEILVIYFKDLLNLIKNAANWKYGEIIDIERNNKFSSEQKFPLTVIDPVQPNRNVSAAVTEEKFNLFTELCKNFSKKPSTKFFKETKISLKDYNLIFKVQPLKGNRDVVGTKMLKVFENIKQELIVNGFEVVKAIWEWKDLGYFYFKVKRKRLEKEIKHFGPPIRFKEDCEKFKIKYKDLEIKNENDKLYIMLPRKFVKLEEIIKHVLNKEEIKNRVYSLIQIK